MNFLTCWKHFIVKEVQLDSDEDSPDTSGKEQRALYPTPPLSSLPHKKAAQVDCEF